MRSDVENLREFAQSGDESAFREIVRQHAPMVQGVAWRATRDHGLAEEVTQTVFMILARKARLISHQELSGWLHRTAFAESLNASRKESRRHRALSELASDMKESPSPEPVWEAVRPHLDELMGRLSPHARQLVVMRYYEQRNYRDISRTTGRTEEACRKQLQRALEHLGALLKKRGVTAPGGALASLLAAQTLCTPTASAAAIASAALSAAPALAGVTALTHTLYLMTTQTILKTSAVSLLLASIPIGLLWNRNLGLEAEVTRIKAESNRSSASNDDRRASLATREKRSSTSASRLSQPPFLPGESRAWIARVEKDTYDEDEQLMVIFKVMQDLSIMSEADVLEACKEAEKLLSLYNQDDPEIRAAFNGDNNLRKVIGLTFYRFSQLNPEKALTLLPEMKGLGPASDMIKTIFSSLARKDLPSALARLEKLPDDQAKKARAGIVTVLSETDAQGALNLLEKQPGGEGSREWLALLLRLSIRDPEVALQAASRAIANGQDPKLLNVLYDRSSPASRGKIDAWVDAYQGANAGSVKSTRIGLLSHDDLPKALQLFASAKATLNAQEQAPAIAAISYNLIKKDPSEAATWISQLPSGTARAEAQTNLLNRWPYVDGPAATAWVEQMPEGPTREGALERISDILTREHPDQALRAASSLRDDISRQKQMQDVIKSWAQKDPDAAAAELRKYQ